MVDYARLLLATEMTGAKTYWHMMPPQDGESGGVAEGTSAGTGGAVPVAYNPTFRGNYMVGNLGMTDVTCTTWFGTENIYVHLINFLPVTPITSELFDKGKLLSLLMPYHVARNCRHSSFSYLSTLTIIALVIRIRQRRTIGPEQ
jgi:hypothetical protein